MVDQDPETPEKKNPNRREWLALVRDMAAGTAAGSGLIAVKEEINNPGQPVSQAIKKVVNGAAAGALLIGGHLVALRRVIDYATEKEEQRKR